MFQEAHLEDTVVLHNDLDNHAHIYYLARMIDAGESVTFIARRIMICASEDVGNADPQALQVAVAASQAVERIGMPEARIILAQAVTYVASAPKSNAAYMAVDQALESVRNHKIGAVPTSSDAQIMILLAINVTLSPASIILAR